MITIRKAHAFRLNSIDAKERMPRPLVDIMTKIMFVSWHNFLHHLVSAFSDS